MLSSPNSSYRKFRNFIKGNKVARSITVLASGTILGQIVTACSMPIISRLYTPAEIGVISVFLAFFTFWAALLSWRFESAVLIAEDGIDLHAIFRLGVVFVFISSFAALPVIMILKTTRTFGFGILPLWSSYVAIPIFLGYGLFMMQRSWVLRRGAVKDISKATMTRAAANAVTRVALGLAGLGVTALFIAEIGGAWGPAVVLNRAARKKDKHEDKVKLIRHDFKNAIGKYSKFIKYELPSVAIDQIGLAIPVPMLASLFGASAAGWYGLARLMVAIPNAQLGKAVGDTFQMELAQCVREHEYIRARQLFLAFLKRLAVLGLVPMVLIMALSPWIVPYIFGGDWREMGVIAAIIAPWLYAALVVGPVSRALSVLQAQEYKLIYDVEQIASFLVVYIIVRHMHFDLFKTVAMLSAAAVVSYVIYLGIITWVMRPGRLSVLA